MGSGSTSSSLTYLSKDLVSKYTEGKGFNTCLLGVHILSITLVLLIISVYLMLILIKFSYTTFVIFSTKFLNGIYGV